MDFHLGEMCRAFGDKLLNEDVVENLDETHFMLNMDNSRTLGFVGDENVKYADVSSGGEGMAMVVRLTGGRDAQIEPPFLIFENQNKSYLIRAVPDNGA